VFIDLYEPILEPSAAAGRESPNNLERLGFEEKGVAPD